MLIIDDKTVKRLVSMKEAIRELERVFKYLGQGKTQMPPKLYIHLDKYNGDFRAMPAYVEPLKKCGIKWVSVYPDNRKRGIPTVMAIIILNDPKTGLPFCIMDAAYATALRTGASGGVAARYLARKSSKKIALIGSGMQAEMQLLALNELFDIETVSVWSLRRNEARRFKREAEKRYSFKVKIANTIRACVEDSDIIATTTPSRKPLVKLSWIKKGAHINAIGADAKGKEELAPEILKKAKVVVDSWVQASHSGEINVPLSKRQLSRKDIYAEIGDIASGKKKGRTNQDEITVFDSTGLAVQDIAIANLVYEKAKELKVGTGFPH